MIGEEREAARAEREAVREERKAAAAETRVERDTAATEQRRLIAKVFELQVQLVQERGRKSGRCQR